MTHPLTCLKCGNRAALSLATRVAHCGCGHTWKPNAELMLFKAPGPDATEAETDAAIDQMLEYLCRMAHHAKESR